VFPRRFLGSIEITSRGAVISAEIVLRARQHGLSIVQIGVQHSRASPAASNWRQFPRDCAGVSRSC